MARPAGATDARRLRRRWAVIVSAGALAGGCASTQLDAQWVDPQLAPGALRGARVLVACEAQEAVLKRICQEQLASEVVARGATAVALPDPASGAAAPTDEAYTQAARSAGARATLAQRVAPYGGSPGTGLTVGLGGFGFGRGGFSGVGIGVSAPLGGGAMTTGYAASTRLIDASSGRLLWSAKASSPPSQDVQGQLRELARTVLESADKSGLF